MRKILIHVFGMLVMGWLLGSGAAVAQDGGGTVNSLTVNPYENQELTGTMATVSGQPNDVTPGSMNAPNGLVPVTTNMSGTGNNENLTLNPATPRQKNAAAERPTAGQESKQNAGSPAAAQSARPKQNRATGTHP